LVANVLLKPDTEQLENENYDVDGQVNLNVNKDELDQEKS